MFHMIITSAGASSSNRIEFNLKQIEDFRILRASKSFVCSLLKNIFQIKPADFFLRPCYWSNNRRFFKSGPAEHWSSIFVKHRFRSLVTPVHWNQIFAFISDSHTQVDIHHGFTKNRKRFRSALPMILKRSLMRSSAKDWRKIFKIYIVAPSIHCALLLVFPNQCHCRILRWYARPMCKSEQWLTSQSPSPYRRRAVLVHFCQYRSARLKEYGPEVLVISISESIYHWNSFILIYNDP